MTSNKNLALALLAIASVSSALSTGCVAVSQSMELEASVKDYFGNPLSTYFDYYLDIWTTDGYHLTYHNDQQQTVANGYWSFTEGNLTFYTDPTGVSCQDTCVSWDAYGCTEFASDCWTSSDVYTLDTNMISSTAAAIGIDFGSGYALYNSSHNFASFSPGVTTFVQNDEFDTNVIVAPGAVIARQGQAGPAAPSALTTQPGSEIAKGEMRTAKPTVVAHFVDGVQKDGNLSADQLNIVAKSRSLRKAASSK
jgi:hypothetical protein